MTFPANWQSPITVQPGQLQSNLSPVLLLAKPSGSFYKFDLTCSTRCWTLGKERSTPIGV